MSLRNEKVRKAVMKEISDILRKEINDCKLANVVSITDVQMSSDNSFAKVYFSVLGDKDIIDQTMESLEKHKSKIRYHLGKRIRLRLTPDLKFFFDDSLERGLRVTELIDKISKGEI